MIRLAADLVQRDQPVVAVEDRVLDGLGHHRAGGLLEAAGEVERAGDVGAVVEVELQQPADELDRLVRLDLAPVMARSTASSMIAMSRRGTPSTET